MIRDEYSWIASDGLSIYAQDWRPEDEPRATVGLVHGLGEHSSRYQHVAERLTSAGFALGALDLRGHGRSAGARGHIPSIEIHLETISRLLLHLEERFPGRPHFLYGHSMGGILVLYFTLKLQPDLAGVIATSPGLRTTLVNQKFKVALAKTLAILTPTVSLASGLDVNHISRDPAIVQAYQRDPFVHDRISFAMARSTLEIIPWVFAHAHEFKPPLLLMHGTADQITFAHGSEEFAQLVECDCTLKLWEGLYHETHNEPEKDQVLDFLVYWLMSKL